jgi:hypothetical protein
MLAVNYVPPKPMSLFLYCQILHKSHEYRLPVQYINRGVSTALHLYFFSAVSMCFHFPLTSIVFFLCFV